MIKVFEGFSGVGSQRMALRNIGADHEVVAIAEIDKYAIESYTAIHGEANNLGDISKLQIEEIPDHDLFTYSFPCQDISLMGNKKGLEEGSGTRSSLLWECRRIIKGKRPKYLLLENVKNLVGKKNKADFDKWLFWLVEQGYTNYWKVENAKHQGVPQNRERVFVVSILGYHEPFEFPAEKPLETRLLDLLEDDVEDKFYLSQEIQDMFLYNPTSVQDLKQVGTLEVEKGLLDSMKRVYDPTGIAPTLMTMGGGNRQPKILIKNNTKLGYLEAEHGDGIDLTRPTSTTRRGRVQKGMSQTLTCADMLGVLEGYEIRKLTPLECWRLMGFSDEDFNKASQVSSNTQLYKQAGNSIVVNCLEGIFRQLFKEVL